MAKTTTLLTLTREDLREIVREEMMIDPMLDYTKARELFGFTKGFIIQLAKEGKITAYPVKDHAKVVRYKHSELLSVFHNYQKKY